MTFLSDLKQAIKGNQPLSPLLDSCIHTPKAHQNPLVTTAIAVFGEQKVKDMLVEAVKDNLFNGIKSNQEALTLLNSTEGRAYLHKNLDSLLSYLVSEKFAKRYKCPACPTSFLGKQLVCPNCRVALKWR